MDYSDLLCGQILNQVYGLVYLDDISTEDKFNKNDILKILLVFNKDSLLIECDEIGVGLKILINPPMLQDTKMDDYGQLKVVDVTNIFDFVGFSGVKLKRIENIIYESNCVGVVIRHSNYKNLFFVNLGDELYIYNDFPQILLDEGYIFES